MSDQSSPNGNPQRNPREEQRPTPPAHDGAREGEAPRPANPDDAFFAYSRQRREGRPPAFDQLANYPPLEPPRIDAEAPDGGGARAAAEDAVRRLRESRRWREAVAGSDVAGSDVAGQEANESQGSGLGREQPGSAQVYNAQPHNAQVDNESTNQPRAPFDRIPFQRSVPEADSRPANPARDPSPREPEAPARSRLAELLDGSTVGDTRGDTGAQRNGSNSTLPPSTLPPAAPTAPAAADSAPGQPAPDGITRKPQRDATEVAERIANRMRHERGEGSVAQPGKGQPVSTQSINIRGRTDGISIELGKGEWSQIMRALTERLDEAADFFRGGRVSLDVGGRPMLEEELLQVRSLLAQHGMVLGNVRSTSERTCQSALTLGMATVLESPSGGADDVLAQPAESNFSSVSHYVYRGNLRSGQVLQLTDSIFLLGDVNPGAQVVSAGDIFIWGRLRGIAHAGVTGDEQSVVAALDLDPTQLRIANHIAIAPEPQPEHTGRWLWKQRVHKRPEVARVAEGGVVVEPWDMLRRGGLATTRR